MIILRDYQQRSIDELRRWFVNNKTGHPLMVLPTGAGKSILCAEIVNLVRNSVRDGEPVRVMVLTHSKELVEQNYNKFCEVVPDLEAGIYAASLRQKDLTKQITFGSIQSIQRVDPKNLPKIHFLIIDECHRINKRAVGGYRKLIDHLTDKWSGLRVVGMTATPYRLDGGHLAEGDERLFDSVATEVTVKELMDAGHLCRVTSPKPKHTFDTKGIAKRSGDFVMSQIREAMALQDGLTKDAVLDIISQTENRHSVLIFAADVAHCDEVQEVFTSKGIRCGVITGDTKPAKREYIINAFKTRNLRFLVNCEVLTTGFDAPVVDCISMLRPTMSTSLYIQMTGRGLRPYIQEYGSKENCLVLDYVGNVLRHGCIDDPDIHSNALSAGNGEAPIKYCEQCEEAIPLSQRTCPYCGYVYPKMERAMAANASELDLMSKDHLPKRKLYVVTEMNCIKHVKKGAETACVRVMYFGYALGTTRPLDGRKGSLIASDWINPESYMSVRKAGEKIFTDLLRTSLAGLPLTTQETLFYLLNRSHPPKFLLVDTSMKYNRVLGRFYGDEAPNV